MWQSSVVGRFFLLAAVVTGCARAPIKPPEASEYSLAGVTAPVRNYAATKLCGVDRELVANETRAFNDLLEKWLDQTSAGADGAWSDEHLALAERGISELPAFLDVHEATLAQLAGCKPEGKVDATEVVSKGQQLISMTRNRVQSAPKTIAEVRHRRVVEAWRTKELATQETERTNWCPPKPKGMPDVFYAWQLESGAIEWLFCDGSKVIAEPDGQPQHVGGPNYDARKRGANKPDAFVKAAQKFPDSEIRRAPAAEAATEPAPAPAETAPAEGEAEAPASEG